MKTAELQYAIKSKQ